MLWGSNRIQANGENLSFADLALAKSLEHNRSPKMMEKTNSVVEWDNIKAVLNEHYEVAKCKEGADAFPPAVDEVHAAPEMVSYSLRS
jgi:hypothetical protein